MKRLKINICNKPGKLSFFSSQRLIHVTSQDTYLNDRQFSSSKLIPVISQENYLHEQIEDPHLKLEEKTIFLSHMANINT